MIKIVTTGPESSGKTTLAKALAECYQVAWVPEYARDYLNGLDQDYQEKDLLEIAKGQIQREDEAAKNKPDLLICDTSLIVIKIWSEYRYGRCHPWILEQVEQRSVDLYLLCSPDIPWEADPLRENPTDRDELFEFYERALAGKPNLIIQGKPSARLAQATNAIDRLLS
ncbi:ATP-binding protein [Tunicatimonas pelagia]|uniref:ATP-binding protein n=1 Tax=Tunicatimonas pelagia TaxID=931531 RepID=UPI002664E58D|nr:ATP-binding protein [Tunicatimonas pelagia]WKN41810.1 ATP-binding protein [Tunicatimonas pelagia]